MAKKNRPEELLRGRLQAELARRGWGPYDLAKHMQGRVGAASVYGYLAGSRRLRDDLLSLIYVALGL